MGLRIRVLVVETEQEGRWERGLRGKINRMWWRTGIEAFDFCLLFIYVFLAVLGLHRCVVFLSSCSALASPCSGLSLQRTGSSALGLQKLWLLGSRALAQ